jgi:hypothetical protein
MRQLELSLPLDVGQGPVQLSLLHEPKAQAGSSHSPTLHSLQPSVELNGYMSQNLGYTQSQLAQLGAQQAAGQVSEILLQSAYNAYSNPLRAIGLPAPEYKPGSVVLVPYGPSLWSRLRSDLDNFLDDSLRWILLAAAIGLVLLAVSWIIS